jgi:hypothetical protein
MAKKKPLTVEEAGRRGGNARAARHSKEELRAWAKLGGRPKGTGKKISEDKDKKGG